MVSSARVKPLRSRHKVGRVTGGDAVTDAGQASLGMANGFGAGGPFFRSFLRTHIFAGRWAKLENRKGGRDRMSDQSGKQHARKVLPVAMAAIVGVGAAWVIPLVP